MTSPNTAVPWYRAIGLQGWFYVAISVTLVAGVTLVLIGGVKW